MRVLYYHGAFHGGKLYVHPRHMFALTCEAFFSSVHFSVSFSFVLLFFSRRWIILFSICLVNFLFFYILSKDDFYICYQLVFYFFFSWRTYLSHFHFFSFTFFSLLYLRSRLSSSVLLNPAKPRGLTSRETAGPRTNSNNSHVSTTRPSLKDNKVVRR